MFTTFENSWPVAVKIARETASKSKDKRATATIETILSNKLPESSCDEGQKRIVRLWYLRSFEGK
jgi:hypothetical protein